MVSFLTKGIRGFELRGLSSAVIFLAATISTGQIDVTYQVQLAIFSLIAITALACESGQRCATGGASRITALSWRLRDFFGTGIVGMVMATISKGSPATVLYCTNSECDRSAFSYGHPLNQAAIVGDA